MSDIQLQSFPRMHAKCQQLKMQDNERSPRPEVREIFVVSSIYKEVFIMVYVQRIQLQP